jgi:hypothetical protein
MKRSDLDDLIDTVERIRLESHPHLDAAFLRAVIEAEEQSLEDEVEALKAIEAALEVALASRGGR